jgi:hypothetical protein
MLIAKPHDHWPHAIGDERAEDEHGRRCDEIGPERVALKPRKFPRHEHVELRSDDWKQDEGGAEHGKLELKDIRRHEASTNELATLSNHPHIGPSQHIVDGPSENETPDKGDAEHDQRLDTEDQDVARPH